MSIEAMTPISERLPEPRRQVLLVSERYWKMPEGFPPMRVMTTGYLDSCNADQWSIFGEPDVPIDVFKCWSYIEITEGEQP